MIDARLNCEQLGIDIIALEILLSEQEQLDERGAGGLLAFFTSRPNLVLLMSMIFLTGIVPAAYLPECSILHEFRADYVISNKERSKFVFIEFEHAKRSSIFCTKVMSKAHHSYQWSRTFEHGFSQVVDWYFRLDDYRRTSRIEEHFGSSKMEYVGVLVLGRDCFLEQAGLMQRFEWRRRYTIINSQRLLCFTFDELARELRDTYATMLAISAV